MIRKNKDILIFQALNWVGSYFLYVSFLKAVSPEIFSKIAAGEVFFGAFGAFLMTWSLRRFDESPSLSSELNALSFRLLLLSFVISSCLLSGMALIYVAAIVPILLTPAHLPLKFGFEKYSYILISTKIVFVFLVHLIDLTNMSHTQIAVIYFLPGILYGVGSYAIYLPRFADVAHLPRPHRTKKRGEKFFPFLLHMAVTVAASLASAAVIARIVESNWLAASVERLARSGYSFVFPHLARRGYIGGRFFSGVYLLLFIASVVAFFYNGGYLYMILTIIPVCVDIFLTSKAGKDRRLDTVMIILFLGLALSLNG